MTAASSVTCFALDIESFFLKLPLIARFLGPTWGPSGADRTQMDPMLAPWTLLSGAICVTAICVISQHWICVRYMCVYISYVTLSFQKIIRMKIGVLLEWMSNFIHILISYPWAYQETIWNKWEMRCCPMFARIDELQFLDTDRSQINAPICCIFSYKWHVCFW